MCVQWVAAHPLSRIVVVVFVVILSIVIVIRRRFPIGLPPKEGGKVDDND